MAKTEINADDIIDAIDALRGAVKVLEAMAADLDIDLSEFEEEE